MIPQVKGFLGTPFAISSTPSSGGNETFFGDRPQSNWSADKVLGKFTFGYVEPVAIEYSPLPSGGYSCRWSTEMNVEDVLGASAGVPGAIEADLLYKIGLGRLFPERRVIRAKWTIGSYGECGCASK